MDDFAGKVAVVTGGASGIGLAMVRRFYVVTHPGILPFVKQRHRDIELLRNPSVEQGF